MAKKRPWRPKLPPHKHILCLAHSGNTENLTCLLFAKCVPKQQTAQITETVTRLSASLEAARVQGVLQWGLARLCHLSGQLCDPGASVTQNKTNCNAGQAGWHDRQTVHIDGAYVMCKTLFWGWPSGQLRPLFI